MLALDKVSAFGVSARDVIAKFGNAVPTPQELAIMCGFGEQRVARLDRMWNIAFNNGWILVTKEMISDEFGMACGRNWLTHFHDNILAKQYENGVDYEEVCHDDERVENYENNCSPKMVSNRRGGHNRKYYVITGRVYKRLLMKAATKAGSDQCDYYCDVEVLGIFYQQVAALLYQILAEAAQRESQEKEVRINQQLLMLEDNSNRIGTMAKELEESKEAVANLQRQVITAKTIMSDQYIYIGTCRALAERNIFKVGGVSSYDDLKQRLASYQTPHSADDPFVFIYTAAVSDFQHVEKRIVQAIGEYRQNPKTNKEMYTLPYEYLLKRVDSIVRGFAAENAEFNSDAELLVKGLTQKPSYVPIAAPWPDPPQGYQQRPQRKFVCRQPAQIAAEDIQQDINQDAKQAAPDDPIKTIINTGINNLTDEQKQELVRQLLNRVAPNVDPNTPATLPSKILKEALTRAAADKKFRVRQWKDVVKPIISKTNIKLTGQW